MFYANPGCSTAPKHLSVFAPLHRLIRQAVVICLLALSATNGNAQTIPLTLAEAERLALLDEPGYVAETHMAYAYANRGEAVLELPDPTLMAGVANFPVSGGGLSSEAMTMTQIGIHQSFPRRESRNIEQRMFKAQSLESSQKAEQRSLDVRESVQRAWLDVFYWTQAEQVVTDTKPLFADLVSVSQSLYELGRKGQKDYLQASLELTRIDDRLLMVQQEKEQAKARLSQWIGQAAQREVSRNLPAVRTLPDIADLIANLNDHPAVQSVDAEWSMKDNAVALAEQKFKPTLGLDFGYGYRSGRMADGSPLSDMVSLQVSVDLPFFGRSRQNKELSAALGERQAMSAKHELILRQMSADLRAEYIRYQQLDSRIALYESSVIELADQGANAALIAYRSDAGDFNDLVRGRIQVLDAHLDLIQLQVWQAQSAARLANLGGLRP